MEYPISEFYRGEVGRGSVEGAIYLSAVVTGSVDIDEATIEIDSESEPARATITIPKGSVHIGDPETCPDCSELVQLNRPFLRSRLSDEEWTALTREALVIINQKVREAGIERQTAARLETVLADFSVHSKSKARASSRTTPTFPDVQRLPDGVSRGESSLVTGYW